MARVASPRSTAPGTSEGRVAHWPQPQAGDVVWCHFPHLPGLEPGPKPRPALVVKVFADFAPSYVVLVAYGTSQNVNRLRAGEFAVTNSDGMAFTQAGLVYETKFSFNQIVELPYTSSYFKAPPGSVPHLSPRLGMLHATLMRKASAAWSAANSHR